MSEGKAGARSLLKKLEEGACSEGSLKNVFVAVLSPCSPAFAFKPAPSQRSSRFRSAHRTAMSESH